MKRVKTVEYDPRWGWIARSPYTGKEIVENFRWSSRSIARTVVWEHKLFTPRKNPQP